MSIIRFISPPLPHYLISGEDTYAPGAFHPSRKNIGVYDLIVVTKGCLYLEEDHTEYAVRSGHYLLLQPNCAHRSYRPCQEETHFYWLHYQTLGASEVVSDQDNLIQPITDQPYQQIDRFSIYLSCCQSLQDPLEVFNVLLELNLMKEKPLAADRWRQQIVFQELLLKLQEGTRPTNSIPHLQIAEQAATYIREHYTEPLSYTELSEAVHFHPGYIARCMKRVFGCTPLEYVTRYRIEQAKLLLIHTDDPIGILLEKAGFGSFPFFVRSFKKHTGFTPRDYRKRFRI